MPPSILKTGWSTGAVAVVDALGVKRLRESRQPADIAQRVREAARTAMHLQNGYLTQVAGHQYPYHSHPLAMDFAALSDTVIVAASVPIETEEPDPQLLSDMVWRTALSLGYLVRRATQADPPLAYRGAIALGRLWRDDYEPPDFPVIQGPAVELALIEYEQAKGAFIHVVNPPDPFESSPWFGYPLLSKMFLNWKVPLKGSCSPQERKVLTPFFDLLPTTDEGQRMIAGFDQATRAKRDYNRHTMRFISHCEVAET
ncbi:MAG: hypothetical protein HKN37_11135 [Rhodothermales bacterium]|nr:hypothetical protein [Rhodothermales bacterium]